jgi:hypothetical protein
VIARHQLLEGAIGVFKEEVYAYSMVTNLCWVLPLIVVVGALIDCLLVFIYMYKVHPWIGILSKEKSIEKEKAEKDVEDILTERNSVVQSFDDRLQEVIVETDQEETIVEPVIEDVNNEVVATDETILDQLEGVGKQTVYQVFHNLTFLFFKNIQSTFLHQKVTLKRYPRLSKFVLPLNFDKVYYHF